MSMCAISSRMVRNQRGMALISALLLLLVVSLLAVGLSMDSSMDIRMAAFQNFKARAFSSAESSMLTSGDILDDNIYDAGWTSADDPFKYPNLSLEYDDLIAGSIDIHGDGVFFMEANPAKDTTMTMTGELDATVSVQKMLAVAAPGSAMQVAAGYAGTGKGSGGGGAHIIYNIEVSGNDADNARADLAMHYRYVTK